jgi:hypothetical protein
MVWLLLDMFGLHVCLIYGLKNKFDKENISLFCHQGDI